MTALLLDSHVLVRWLHGSRLSRAAQDGISDPSSAVFYSVASVWELAIKEGLGRLTMPDDFTETLNQQGVELLGIGVPHARAVRELPPLHRDPFDRMLVAQAQVEGLTLVTRDKRRLLAYDVRILQA